MATPCSLTEIHDQALEIPLSNEYAFRVLTEAEGTLHLSALARVKEVLTANPAERHSMDELERIAGMDRWTLARQFRAVFGASPRRFRTLRQLERVRGALQQGKTLTDAALEAGFSDQSHMTRQFKLAYGMTPRKWQAAACR